MSVTRDIDLKIAELKKKKEEIRLKAADSLFKKLEKIAGDDMDLTLILGLVSSSLQNASDKQKEEWRKAGSTFLKSRTEKI